MIDNISKRKIDLFFVRYAKTENSSDFARLIDCLYQSRWQGAITEKEYENVLTATTLLHCY